MKTKKTTLTSITGGLTSAAPILFACCKSGACLGVCASPIASLFGVSSATLASSPWIGVAEPILIAVSAVSFTISYYSLYLIPKINACGPDDCACEPTASEKRKNKIAKFVFWFGLFLSLGFLTYFEYSKYQSANNTDEEECNTRCTPGNCDEEAQETHATTCDSSSSCCSEEITAITNDSILNCKLTSKELSERKKMF